MNAKIASCYGTLSVIRKLKNICPFNVRKQLAKYLILSKIDYSDIDSHPIPEYLQKRLQRVQLAAACLFMGDMQISPIYISWVGYPLLNG